MRILRLDDTYSHISPAWWQAHMFPPSKGLRGCDELLEDLRDFAPKGTEPSHREMPVILLPGKAIGKHKHPEWTLVYFIDAEETPIVVRDLVIHPANNTAIMLTPNTEHWVMQNRTDRPRLSLALRFKDE